MSNANERKSPKSMLDSKKSPLGPEPRKRLMTFGLIALVIGILLGPRLYGSSTVKSISYTEFLSSAKSGGVATATVENYSGVITGTLENGTQYSVLGPDPAIAKDITMLRNAGINVKFKNPSSLGQAVSNMLQTLFIFGIIGLFTIIGIFTPGMGWFLYFFLIPFWALFPIVVVGVNATLGILATYLIGFPAAKLLLPRTQWFKSQCSFAWSTYSMPVRDGMRYLSVAFAM